MTYTATRRASYISYIVQGIINNLLPLFFIIFQESFGLNYERLGSLVLINFVTQIAVDVLSIRFVEKLGYRPLIIASQAFAALGLVLLGVLPVMLKLNIYPGLLIATVTSAVGGGLLEVLVSPITDALPSPQNKKASNMSLLHSFYCWGQALVVLLTTLLLRLTGEINWWIIPILWAIIPFFNMFIYFRAPLPKPVSEEKRMGAGQLFKTPVFIAIIFIMICGGASEATVAQWASLFADQSLGLAKVWGDIAGPCVFALTMGAGRILYSVFGGKVSHSVYMAASALLCSLCYLMISLGNPVASLLGCAVCGVAVSVMWPGTLSFAAARFPFGGALMFGVLSMGGDIGCSVGPWLSGVIADNASAGLSAGILAAIVFPVTMALLIFVTSRNNKSEA